MHIMDYGAYFANQLLEHSVLGVIRKVAENCY